MERRIRRDVMESQTNSRMSPFSLFAGLWAGAHLFEVASKHAWDLSILFMAQVIVSICVLHRPSSVPRFASLCLFQCLQVWNSAPLISNHLLFTAGINALILMALAQWVWKQGGMPSGMDLYNRFAPAARWSVMVLYFFVVFHKLNTDFLDPTVSCGAHMYLEQRKLFPFLPDSVMMMRVSIWMTLIVETLIPLLFVFRRTRYAGIALGLLFHVTISYNPMGPFYNFTVMLIALYALFLPDAFCAGLAEEGRLAKAELQAWRKRLSGLGKWGSAVGVVLIIYLISAFSAKYSHAGRWVIVVWTLYGVGGSAIFLLVWLRQKPQVAAYCFRSPAASTYVIPVLLFLNACSPYLGLKTETSLAMFSNLRTEGGLSNHLVVPVGLQVFDYQKDLVRIRESSQQFLQQLGDRELLIPWFEFRDLYHQYPAKTLLVERNGELLDLGDGRGDMLVDRHHWLERKFLYFRRIGSGDAQGCRH